MTKCDSSMFSAYEWDESWTLTVVFQNGQVRAYAEVPPETFAEFEAAKSKGSYYNQHIKGKFESLKAGIVTDPELQQAIHETKTATTPEQIDAALAKPVEDEALITDADIRAVDPSWKGDVKEASIGEILAKTDNVGMSVPKADRTELQTLVDESRGLTVVSPPITSPAMYSDVSEKLKRKVAVRDRLFSILDPVRKALWDALTLTRQQHGLLLDPLDASISADKQALLRWNTEQQRIAAQKQREAQLAAEAEAAAEQARRTEALRMQVAQEQAEAGDMQQAEASLFDETIQAAPVQVYAPRVEADVPAVEGQSMRKNWCAEVTDFALLVEDVAAGIKSMRDTGSLAGHAPINVLEVKTSALNQLAKASESMLRIPGVVAVNKPVMAVRKGK